MKSDYSNVAGETLRKVLSAMDIFLQILQEFRNDFLKKHRKIAALAAFVLTEIKSYHLN